MQECCVLQVMADGHIFSIIIMGNGYYNSSTLSYMHIYYIDTCYDQKYPHHGNVYIMFYFMCIYV